MQTAEEILSLLKTTLPALRERYHIKRIGLFGSVAKGQAHTQSDIDILVEFEVNDEVEVVSDSKDIEDALRELISPKVRVDIYPLANANPDVRNSILATVIWVK